MAPVGHYPAAGYVNVSLIESADPRMAILQSVDTAILSGKKYARLRGALPADLKVDQFVAYVSTLGTVDLKTGLEAEQEMRLAAVSANILDFLNRRLLEAQNLEVEALRAERLSAGRIELANVADALEQQAVDEAEQYEADVYRISSLKMQIAAMKVNEVPPRTAPKGYWSNIQSLKEAELTLLLQEYAGQLQSIYQKRDAAISLEQKAINQRVDNAIMDAKAVADTSRLAALADAKSRFDAEQLELATEDKTVFDEANRVISSQSGYTRKTGGTTGVGTLLSVRPIPLETLMQYRQTLKTKIWTDAKSSIDAIAQKLHIKVVGKRPGVVDVTPVFVTVVKDQNWKVS